MRKRLSWADDEQQVPTPAILAAVGYIQNAAEIFMLAKKELDHATDALLQEPYDPRAGYLAGKLWQWHNVLNHLVGDDLMCERFNWDLGEPIPESIMLPSAATYHPQGEDYAISHPRTEKIVDAD